MDGRAFSTRHVGSPNHGTTMVTTSGHSRFRAWRPHHGSSTVVSSSQWCKRCPETTSSRSLGLFHRLDKCKTDSVCFNCTDNEPPSTSLYRSGYDNLAVGHFMPQPINSSPTTSVIKNSLPMLKCLTTMHLDILPSPVGSGNSPLHNNFGSSVSPLAEMSPDSNFIHSAGNKDSYNDAEVLSDSNLLCYNHDLLSNYSDDVLANLISSDHLYSSCLESSSFQSSNAYLDVLHSNDLSSIFLSPQSSSVNTPPSELPLSPTPMEKDEATCIKTETLPPSSRDFSESDSGVQMAPPLPTNYSDLSSYPASLANPRHSYSSRSSRNKRSLSISPLSAEGLDLNAIIRMSPTSLVAYLGGSHSSSSSMSPAGDKTGCYGHLSARNSAASPQSTLSGPRLSSYSQSQLPLIRDDSLGLDSNLAVYQSMEMLESNCFLSNSVNQEIISADDSAQFLDQQRVKSEPYNDSCLYPGAEPAGSLPPPVPIHPPPSYDQHMARKLKFQKKNSSDSSQSQPSSYSSFDSSEGERAADGTDTEQGKPHFVCRWVDCVSTVFPNQDELVKHIEKCHIDQRKGEDFACFWQSCPRRYRPFNARYKLLIHMRVHTGEKPNKCTFEGCTKAFSRLENLKIHLRSHTGERPYVCQYTGCCKAFSNSSDRAKHQRTHQDTKPYACQVPGCTKRYTDPSSLRKHVKNHSAKPDPAKKKLRSGLAEIDADLLNECLIIQPIVPIHPNENAGLDSLPEIHAHGKRSINHPRGNPAIQQSCHLERRSELHRSEAVCHSNFPSRIPVLPPIRHHIKPEVAGPKSYSYRESDSIDTWAKDSRKAAANFPSVLKQHPEDSRGNATLPPLEGMATNFASFDPLSHFGGIS